MKKFIRIIICAIVLASLNSCTSNHIARHWGGNETITLDAGQKLVLATWNDGELWYLTEPMDSSYKPQTKTFKEKSSFGMLEGTVVFIERR